MPYLAGMFADRRLLHIYAIIFIDVVVGSVIGPILPQFVKGLDRPQLWLAAGTGLFLGVQLFSAPLLGKLSDAYGRRPIFIVSAVGTFLADLLLLPVRVGFYFANRLSDGTTNGMYATVRSAITDISPEDKLFKNLGIEGAIISLGFVVGPAAGGLLLTVFDIVEGEQARAVALMAVVLSAVNIVLSWTLRETHPSPPHRNGNPVSRADLKAELLNAVSVHTLWTRLTNHDRSPMDVAVANVPGAAQPARGLRQLVLMQLFLTLSTGYYFYFVTFASFGELRLDAKAISYFFMYFGALSIVINYVFYTFLADRINQRRAIVWLAALGAPVLAGYGLVGTSMVTLYVLVTLDCLTLSLIQGLLEGLMAQRTTEADRGEIFGINQALQGLASFGTTVVFGALSVLDLRLPFGWFAVCLAMVAVMAGRYPTPSPEREGR